MSCNMLRWMAALWILAFSSFGAGAQTPNDQDNFFGDHLRVSVNVKAVSRDDDSAVCIPGGTSMIVIGQDQSFLYVKLTVPEGQTQCDGIAKLFPGVAYKIDRDDLAHSGLARTGITYGALVVPFKYQTSGNKDFTGSASIGGYAGYRFETLRRLGVTATPIFFMGASNISVSRKDGTGSDNVMGFTYGVGLVGTFKGAFQSGVVVGWDRVGKSANYEYSGKPWIAIEIGYAFLQ